MKMQARGGRLSRTLFSSGFTASATLHCGFASSPGFPRCRNRHSMLDCPPMRRIAVISAALVLSCVSVAQTAGPNVVHYKLDEKKLKYLFATSEPVMHLKSDDVLETNT